MTKPAPCYVASSTTDEKDPPLYISSAFGHDLAVNGGKPNFDLDIKVQMPVRAMFINQATVVTECTTPYQFSLLPEGANFHDYFRGVINPDEVFDAAAQAKRESEKLGWNPFNYIMMSTWTLVVVLYSLILDTVLAGFAFLPQVLVTMAESEVMFRLMNTICLGGLTKPRKMKDYNDNLTYPVIIPTPSEAGSAWLSNEIDDCTFETYVKAGDNVFEPFKKVVRSQKFKFSALELMTLNRRGKLQRDTMQNRLRELGSLEAEDRGELESLFTQVPGPSDIIRFMQRDVVNQEVVGTFQLGTGFTDNYVGRLQEVGQQQGLTDEQMQWEWMAHWSIPSPTQLYEMLHRLRHDPAEGGADKVTKDVELALRQQDILPYWIPRLMKISYHPLTRTDLNRAYDRGWITDDDYLNGMYHDGYSDDDAKQLLRFAKNERKVAIRNLPEVKAFTRGFISGSQLEDIMNHQDWDQSIIPDILDEALYQWKFRQQEEKIQAITRQYRACRITEDEALKDAEMVDVPIDLMQEHLDVAGLNSTCGTRREWASQLCTALEQGTITEQAYIDRMKVLKFDDMAINVQLSICTNRIAAQRVRQQLKEQAQQAKEQKQAQQAELRAEKQAAQQARRLQGIAMSNERRRQSRNAKLAHAAETLGGKLSDVTGPPTDLVNSLFASLQTQLGLSQDEAADVLSTAATGAKGQTTQEFMQWITADALTMLSTPWQLFPAL